MFPSAAARVDDSGEALLEHLRPGSYTLTISLSGETYYGFALEVVVAQDGAPEVLATRRIVVSGRNTVVDLRSYRGARVEGTFLRGSDPVRSDAVMLFGGPGYRDQLGWTEADNEGQFLFESVEPGRYRLIGEVSGGFVDVEFEVRERDKVVSVDLVAGSASVRGRVFGIDGEPAAEASVLVVRADTHGPARSLSELASQVVAGTNANEEGRYELTGLRPGNYRILCGLDRRLIDRPLRLRARQKAEVDLRFEPRKLRRLEVHLVDARGEPVDGTVVLLDAHGGLAGTCAILDDPAEEQAPEAVHIFLVPSGDYRLSASAQGLAQVVGKPLRVRSDRSLTLRLERGSQVTLLLVRDGRPAPGEPILLFNEDGLPIGDGRSVIEMVFQPGQLRSDHAGRVLLPPLLPGAYAVHTGGREIGGLRVRRSPRRQTYTVKLSP